MAAMNRTSLLYIEASKLIQNWVGPLLNELGYETTHVQTLEDAQRLIKRETPITFVLLGDISRPSDLIDDTPLAELSIIRSLRNRDAYNDTSIIVFSSCLTFKPLALENGANAFLEKPAGPNELKATLEPFLPLRALRTKRARAAN